VACMVADLSQIIGNSKASVMTAVMNEVDSAPWWRVILVGRKPKRTLLRIVILIVGVMLLRQFVMLPIRVDGISMLPTYKSNAVNFVNRLAYVFGQPQRGDVVAIRMAGEHIMLMKRVVGLPGETVEFRRGKLFINGEATEEDYLKLPSQWNMPSVKVGPGEYYVVGDNRTMAWSDHKQGRAPLAKIVGRVIL
jgi:signal peptidase I